MLDIFDNSSSDGFTRGIVVVVVEGVVEELELGAEAINGGSDTMKSIAVKERNKGNREAREREIFDEEKSKYYYSIESDTSTNLYKGNQIRKEWNYPN